MDKESRTVKHYEVSNGKSNYFINKNQVGGIRLGDFKKGKVYEYIIYALNGKIWSKSSDPLYITYEIPKSNEKKETLKKGKKYEVHGLLYQYQGKSFKLTGAKKDFRKMTVKIPAPITVFQKTYPVTAIGANAFKNNKNIKQAALGKNIVSIRNNAFSDYKSLSKITIKSTKLANKKIGKNAFRKPGGGSTRKVTVELPKKKFREYKKLLQKRIVYTKKVKLRYKKI